MHLAFGGRVSYFIYRLMNSCVSDLEDCLPEGRVTPSFRNVNANEEDCIGTVNKQGDFLLFKSNLTFSDLFD